MCGLSGIISDKLEDVSSYECIAKELEHRGPDFFGKHLGSKYAFFHNRLSIIDLSDNANQPYINDHYVLIYNGEIYNYKELYRKYFHKEAGSDTEALSYLLIKKGRRIISELNGMFAFLFYDTKKETAIFSRDRLGIKPFYYSLTNGNLTFSSELKTLLKFNEVSKLSSSNKVSRFALDDIIAFGHLEFGVLPFEKMVELSPGSVAEYDLTSKAVTIQPYFKLADKIKTPINKSYNTTSSLIDRLDELLCESVKNHLLSDVKIGSLCSGGIDSSVIAAIALKFDKDVSIYHSGTKGHIGEEKYAREVAEYIDAKLNVTRMDAEYYWRHFTLATYYSDLPIYHHSDIALYQIAEKAHSEGVKVLLCGEGADELFGGYSWHLNFKKQVFLPPFHKKLNQISWKLIRKLFKSDQTMNPENYLDLTSSYVNYFPSNLDSFARRNTIIRNRKGHKFFGELLEAYKILFPKNRNSALLGAYISNNLAGHLSSILHRSDRMCMMTSIEARVPFIENSLIDFALTLDPKFKIRKDETKFLLKKVAERYLPKKIVYRKKLGFPIPWADYLKSFNQKLLDKGFLYRFYELDYSQIRSFTEKDPHILFTFISLEIWGRLFVLNEEIDSINKDILI